MGEDQLFFSLISKRGYKIYWSSNIFVTENFSPNNIFVKSVFLNGEKLDRAFITHKEIISGGELTFVMSNKAQKQESGKRSIKTPKPDKIYQ